MPFAALAMDRDDIFASKVYLSKHLFNNTLFTDKKNVWIPRIGSRFTFRIDPRQRGFSPEPLSKTLCLLGGGPASLPFYEKLLTMWPDLRIVAIGAGNGPGPNLLQAGDARSWDWESLSPAESVALQWEAWYSTMPAEAFENARVSWRPDFEQTLEEPQRNESLSSFGFRACLPGEEPVFRVFSVI